MKSYSAAYHFDAHLIKGTENKNTILFTNILYSSAEKIYRALAKQVLLGSLLLTQQQQQQKKKRQGKVLNRKLYYFEVQKNLIQHS